MPIDASLYQRFTAAQGDAPRLATMGEIQDAKALREDRMMQRKLQLDALRLKQQEAEQQAVEQEVIGRAFQRFGRPDGSVDQEAVLAAVRPFPTAYQKLEKHFGEMRKQAVEAESKRYENAAKKFEVLGSLLQGVQSPEDYALIKPALDALDPELSQTIGDYTPEKRDLYVAVGTSRADYNKQMHDNLLRDDTEESKVLNAMSLAHDEDDWNDALEMADVFGVTNRLKAYGLVGPYSPEQAKRAGELTKTPKDRTSEANQAEGNAIAAGNLDVARGNLALRRQELAAQTGTGGSGGGNDAKLVAAIMKNPQIYEGLTPTIKSRIAVPLSEAGFNFAADAGSGKPATGLQKRALNFFNRGYQASQELDNLEPDVSKMNLMQQGRMEYAPNVLQSQTGQSYAAAQRAFTEARLRKDSGAAIPPSEFDNDRRTYFVQPGDTAETQAQKKRARAALLASLAYESGSAMAEYYGDEATSILEGLKAQAKGQARTEQPPASQAATPARVNPFRK